MKRDNLPYNVVSDIMFQLYRMHDIPKSVELPKELLDTIQIGSLTKEEAAQLQALEESDVEKGEEKTDV
jgi:16S rRNA A1518/A1519 N6-dimethyltransferase RsmA/KsgA/DIM1 with predicted DNA glycosylase/AP lyase activity